MAVLEMPVVEVRSAVMRVIVQCASGKDGGAAYAERKARLEARGFLVSGYEGMSPAQARNLLVLRLSAYGWAGCNCNSTPDVTPTLTPRQGSARRLFKRSSSRNSSESLST